MADERIIVFIDGSNLYHSLRNEMGRTDLDFQKFSVKFAGPRNLVRTYYYNAPVDQSKEPQRYGDQRRFFRRIETLPYMELKLGRLVYPNWPNVPPYEKGIDVKIATDILVFGFRGNYDTLILVSRDTDFADALQAVKDVGKHMEVVLFGHGWSSQQLRKVADKVMPLDSQFLAGCWI